MRPGMIRTPTAALLGATVLVLGAAVPVSAQRFSAELRAGGAIGSYTQTDAGLDLVPGPAFAATVEVGFTESVAMYVGINRSSFGCEEALCTGRDISLTSQGVLAGGRFSAGLVWARAGMAIQALRVATDAVTETSSPALGWDLAGGVAIPVGQGFEVRPGITYLRHGASTDGGDDHVALLALELGVAMEF